MKIKYSGNLALWAIGNVVIRPGLNEVDAVEWSKIRNLESVVKAKESFLLAELEEFVAPEPKPEPKPEPESGEDSSLLSALGMTAEELEAAGGLSRVDLRDYHWNASQDIVTLVDDVRVLLSWDDVEHRASVKKTLEARLGDLRQ